MASPAHWERKSIAIVAMLLVGCSTLLDLGDEPSVEPPIPIGDAATGDALDEVGGDGGDADAAGSPDADADASGLDASTHRRIFVSSMPFTPGLQVSDPTGNLRGGLEGLDALCQVDARTGSLDGAFIAWASASDRTVGGDAIQRVTEGAWYLTSPTETLVFSSKADLAGGTPKAGITYGAKGMELSLAGQSVWTGTSVVGAHTTMDCGSWTVGTAAVQGTAGLFGVTTSQWTDNGTAPCTNSFHVICIQQ